MKLKNRIIRTKPPDACKYFSVWLIVILSLLLTCATTGILAQSSSANYKIYAGGPVGGGGSSSSPSYKVVGNVPLGAGEISASANYSLSGGIIGTISGAVSFTAEYGGGAVEVVGIDDMLMKIAYGGGSGGAATGTVYYRPGGSPVYRSASMSAGAGDTLVYNFPAGSMSIRGVEYYFAVARDGMTANIGNANQPYVLVNEFNNAYGQRPTAMPDAQYRIIGVPIEPVSRAATAVFGDDLGDANDTKWRLGRHNSSTGEVDAYPSVKAVNPGVGYWLIARGSKTYGSEGISVRPDVNHMGNLYYEVPLDSGWNMLANPFGFSISWNEIIFDDNGTIVTTHPGSILEDVAYRYTGTGYQATTVISAWEGVFVNIAKSGVQALIRYREVAVMAPPIDKPAVFDNPQEWAVELRLESDGLYDNSNFAGVRADALAGPDKYDFSEPPPAPNAPYLAFIQPITKSLKRTDFRKPFEDGATWDISIAKAKNRKITLVGIENLPENLQTVFILENSSTIYPKDGVEILLSDDIENIKMVVGNKEYLDEKSLAIPINYALHQNYPNPFNPQTSIAFVIPEAGYVRLDVHNVLGQRVKTLIDGELERGEYSVTWYGKDENDVSVASGIYFYRITVANFSQSRKMVLLK